MISAQQITQAISKHSAWKYDLLEAIEKGKSGRSVVESRADDRCEFGRWLHALPPHEKVSEHWKQVQALHAQFHQEAARVLDLALQGRVKEARVMMETQGRFAEVSSQMVIALTKWQSSLP